MLQKADIRQIRPRRNPRPLLFHTVLQGLLFLTRNGGGKSKRHRMHCQKAVQKHRSSLFAILLHPKPHQPFRHGIFHGKKSHRILLTIRHRKLVSVSGDCSENTVHKALEAAKAPLGRKLAGFVADGIVRHHVHIQQLVDAHPQQASNQRAHLVHGKL